MANEQQRTGTAKAQAAWEAAGPGARCPCPSPVLCWHSPATRACSGRNNPGGRKDNLPVLWFGGEIIRFGLNNPHYFYLWNTLVKATWASWDAVTLTSSCKPPARHSAMIPHIIWFFIGWPDPASMRQSSEEKEAQSCRLARMGAWQDPPLLPLLCRHL